MHERAFASLELSRGRNGLSQRAEIFFGEALTPIVEMHRAGRQSQIDMSRLSETLTRRTLELAATNRQLRRCLLRRKRAEAALKMGGLHYRKLLQDSLDLQEGLRQLTHRNLSALETERQTISHQLQDEIAQTLLGINVRLLTLKRAARGNASHLTKEIASTQRLVEESVKSIHRFARELDTQQPA
jgi:signal transduction histidine kinase